MFHFLAMEYIDGLDLSRITRRLGRLDVPDACELIRVAAAGLAHAHAEGIVHRDVKPSNLILSYSGKLKVVDFGLARINQWDETSFELTTVGQLMGTLDYMAPEQADHPEAVDYRADIYSLGATLFRLLAGRPPLAASPTLSPLAKLRLLIDQQPPHLDSLRDDLPAELVAYVHTMLDRDVNQRPASASHVAEALAKFAEGHNLPALARQAKQAPEDDSHTAETITGNSTTARPKESSHRIGWAVAAAALLLLSSLGAFITLETQKGNWVVESDVAMTLEVLRDGKPYDELEIRPGPQSTRLFAGNYELRIQSPSDHVRLLEDKIEIRRGETTITRLRRQTKTAADVARANLPASDAPLRPGQELELKCSASADIEGTFRVMADYTIKPRLVGVVSVRGENLATLENKLNRAYQEFLPRTDGRVVLRH